MEFDGIATGFLGSKEQVDIVIDFIHTFKTDKSVILIDPVMGDYGQLYKTYTPEMCEKMKELVGYANMFRYNIDIKKEDVINKFDETCQGTVPVALWVIYHSRSFEDAVRKAVSLGADADTLGAIVGGIAEQIWGIPDDIKERAMSMLPDEMKHVVKDFYEHYNRRKL